MYVIQIKTLLSEWNYGPFHKKHHAEKWINVNGYKDGEYKIIHLVPVIMVFHD
jgi:hypothetical protein